MVSLALGAGAHQRAEMLVKDNKLFYSGFGCDESSLLGDGILYGHNRSLFQGAVYRFYCESGAMMQGNPAVYCDGHSWNGTKPECLGN